MTPQISVVIPVKNEAAKIRSCIEGILAQTVPVHEIIVIDSGSTDGTIEILEEYKQIKLLKIPSSEFNHGDTRNLGVRAASGDFVLLTVGDAKPYDEFWIQHLLDGFDSAKVAGVCGQQVCPHDRDKNPVDWFRPIGEPTKRHCAFTQEEIAVLEPGALLAACCWDDVTAIYRKEVLMQIPFKRTSYCEDAIWARDALKAGYTIVYNTAARVYHYHIEDPEFSFKRGLTTLYMRYKQFGYTTPFEKTSLRKKLSVYKTIAQTKPLSTAEKWKWVQYTRAQWKAARKAHLVFLDALLQGEDVLEKTHEKFCGKPPIPVKQPVLVP